MYGVELYAAVRLAVVDGGLSHHEAGRRFGIDRRTVKKMLSYSAPPGYRRTKPVRRPKLGGFTGIVDAILEAGTDPGRAAQAGSGAAGRSRRLERSAGGALRGATTPSAHMAAWDTGRRPQKRSSRQAGARLRYAPPTIQLGRETANALTFKPVQSTGGRSILTASPARRR